MTYNQVKGSAEYIMSQTRLRPKIAIVLGTGLNGIVNEIENAVRIPYKNIPRWSATTNKYHECVLVIGTFDGVPVAVMNGRLHYYDGNSIADCAYPIATLKAMGVEKIFMSNCAGGINPDFKEGDMMLISDHIKFFDDSPLRGDDGEMFGRERFFSMEDAYDRYLCDKVSAKYNEETGFTLKKGVYAYMPGPQFETPAVIRALSVMGADAVGMSTVPEVIMAVACKMKVVAVSTISNMAAGVGKRALKLGEIEETNKKLFGDFEKLVHVAVKVMNDYCE